MTQYVQFLKLKAGMKMRSSVFLILAYIFCRKEGETMAVVYATLIVKGKKTLEEVPARLKADVQELLETLEITL